MTRAVRTDREHRSGWRWPGPERRARPCRWRRCRVPVRRSLRRRSQIPCTPTAPETPVTPTALPLPSTPLTPVPYTPAAAPLEPVFSPHTPARPELLVVPYTRIHPPSSHPSRHGRSHPNSPMSLPGRPRSDHRARPLHRLPTLLRKGLGNAPSTLTVGGPKTGVRSATTESFGGVRSAVGRWSRRSGGFARCGRRRVSARAARTRGRCRCVGLWRTGRTRVGRVGPRRNEAAQFDEYAS